MSAQNLISSGASTLSGLIAGVLALVVILGVAGAFIVIVVANRAEPDPTGRRPFVVYLFGVAFITIWTALIGSATVVSSLVQLIGSHPETTGGSIHPIGDAAARGAVLGGLVLFVSVATLVLHLCKGLSLANGEGQGSTPVRRCAQSYVSSVAFVSVLVVVISLVTAIYLIFRIVAPGVFGGAGRIPVLRHLIDAAYVALAGGVILWRHLKMASPQLWPWRAISSAEGPAPQVNP